MIWHIAVGDGSVRSHQFRRRWAQRGMSLFTRAPFERGIDDDQLAHHHKGTWLVRISTNQARSESWEEAYEQALKLMRDADTLRQSSD